MREVSAGIIIYRKTKDGLKFLILYHGRGYWNFPKGKIESKTEETSLSAALREVQEETGIALNELKLYKDFKVYEKFVFWRKNEKIFKIVIFYLAQAQKSEIKISSEHEGYGWFTYREGLNMLKRHKGSQNILRQAYKFIQKV